MNPHDLSGLPICRGDVVVCPIPNELNKLCWGVVKEVCYNTGSIVVLTVVITRINPVEEFRFLFPANQVKMFAETCLMPHAHPEHKIVQDLHKEHNS